MLLRNIWREGEIFFGCQGWLSRNGDGRITLNESQGHML